MSKRGVLTASLVCLAVLALPAGASRQFTSTELTPSWVTRIDFAINDVGTEEVVPGQHAVAKVKKVQPKKLAKKAAPARAPAKIAARPVPARAAAAQASAPRSAPSGGLFNINIDPGQFIFNQALNQIPGPTATVPGMVHGAVIGGAGNLIYAAGKMNITEGRELGHGEACAVLMNSVLGVPFVPIWTKPCIDIWAKVPLCTAKEYWNHPPPERTVVPNEAYDAWYLYRYCNGPAHPEYDVLLKEAGYTYPLKRYVTQ